MNKRMMFFRKKVIQICCVLGMMELVSCNSQPQPELSMKSVSIFAEPDANQNSAMAVDLVLVYNQELLNTLGQMSASKYFESSRQVLLDNPTLLDVWHWELVPGQIVEDFDPPQEKGNAFGGYVFANYLTPGDHRVKVAPNGVVKILLLKNDLKNLAAYDIRDVRNGTTMTNALNSRASDGMDLCDVGIIKRGPTKMLERPRKKVATKCSPKGTLPPCPTSVVGAPLPIRVQPLAPCPRGTTPMKPLKPYPLKVK